MPTNRGSWPNGLRFCGHLPLDGDRRDDRLVGLREHREERIALRAHLHGVVCPELRAHDRPVALQQRRVPVAEGLEEARGAFDVAEEERERAAGQVAHRGQVSACGRVAASRSITRLRFAPELTNAD